MMVKNQRVSSDSIGNLTNRLRGSVCSPACSMVSTRFSQLLLTEGIGWRSTRRSCTGVAVACNAPLLSMSDNTAGVATSCVL
jgi:hypothetical protein